jgi:hypothetical protein
LDTGEIVQANVKKPSADFVGIAWLGDKIDFKRMSQPWALSFDRLLNLGPEKLRVLKVSSNGDRFTVRFSTDKTDEDYYEIVFDSAMGFADVRDTFTSKGRLIAEIDRSFADNHGDIYAKSIDVKYWGYTGERSQPERRTQVDISSFDPNVDLPIETFDLRGFNLPPNVNVYDTTLGLTYSSKPAVSIERATSDLLDTVHGTSLPAVANSHTNNSLDAMAASNPPQAVQHSYRNQYILAVAAVALGLILAVIYFFARTRTN